MGKPFRSQTGETILVLKQSSQLCLQKGMQFSSHYGKKKLGVISAVILVVVVSFSWFCFNLCDLAAAAAMLLGLRNDILAFFFLLCLKTVTH